MIKSFSKEADALTVAAEVRMERQKHKGSFLLVEGATDIKRFRKLVAEDMCSFVNCFGKPNVIGAIEQLYDDGLLGCLGLFDADFDRLRQRLLEHEGLVASETHDFDLDMVLTSALMSYLEEVGDSAKIEQIGGSGAVGDFLLQALKPLSAMRYANEKHGLGYSLESVSLQDFFDGNAIDVDAMVASVSWGRMNTSEHKETLKNYIERYVKSAIDLRQVTSGHDFCEALGISLRNKAGDRKPPQTWRSEIELHLRLTCDREHFDETNFCNNVRRWENENIPFRVLI